MSSSFFILAVSAAQLLLGLAMALATLRLLRGPRAQDRVLALDTLYVNAMLLVLTFGVRSGSSLFFEACSASSRPRRSPSSFCAER